MSNGVGRKIVRSELRMGFVAVSFGAMITLSMGIPTDGIVIGVGVALLTAALLAGADRSRLGLWIFGASGVLAIVGVVLVGTEPWVVSLLPVSMLGMVVGWLLNRVLFGVVGPVPETRIERGFQWSG